MTHPTDKDDDKKPEKKVRLGGVRVDIARKPKLGTLKTGQYREDKKAKDRT